MGKLESPDPCAITYHFEFYGGLFFGKSLEKHCGFGLIY